MIKQAINHFRIKLYQIRQHKNYTGISQKNSGSNNNNNNNNNNTNNNEKDFAAHNSNEHTENMDIVTIHTTSAGIFPEDDPEARNVVRMLKMLTESYGRYKASAAQTNSTARFALQQGSAGAAAAMAATERPSPIGRAITDRLQGTAVPLPTPFGTINTTSGTLYGPRQLQVSAKLFF